MHRRARDASSSERLASVDDRRLFARSLPRKLCMSLSARGQAREGCGRPLDRCRPLSYASPTRICALLSGSESRRGFANMRTSRENAAKRPGGDNFSPVATRLGPLLYARLWLFSLSGWSSFPHASRRRSSLDPRRSRSVVAHRRAADRAGELTSSPACSLSLLRSSRLRRSSSRPVTLRSAPARTSLARPRPLAPAGPQR